MKIRRLESAEEILANDFYMYRDGDTPAFKEFLVPEGEVRKAGEVKYEIYRIEEYAREAGTSVEGDCTRDTVGKIRRLSTEEATLNGDLVALCDVDDLRGTTIARRTVDVFRVEDCDGEGAKRLRSERDKAFSLLSKILVTFPDSVMDKMLDSVRGLRP